MEALPRMDSSESNDHDPEDSSNKEPQNEACTGCRAIKRRCVHLGSEPCTRCARLKLECVYMQNKRGRKRLAESGSGSGSANGKEKEKGQRGPYKKRAISNDPVPSTSSAGASPSHLPMSSPKSMAPPAPASKPTSTVQPAPSLPLHLSHPFLHPPNGNPGAPIWHSPSPPVPSPSSSNTSGPSGTGAASAVTGGFSLKRLLAATKEGEKEVEVGNKRSLADAFGEEEERQRSGLNRIGTKEEKKFEDAVSFGIVPADQVDGLFDFYFTHLNPQISLLDPVLHTSSFCRHSSFLFTSILLASLKALSSPLYFPTLRYLRTLFGQAFEYGIATLEFVQSLAIAAFWNEHDDGSIARKIGFAIRCAYELGLGNKKRPLPEDDGERRRVLNRERTWLHLSIADHRSAYQQSLPRLISADKIFDPLTWMLEHSVSSPCPSEAGLGPLLGIARLLEIFDTIVNAAQEDSLERGINEPLLNCLEVEWMAWRNQWVGEDTVIPMLPYQASLNTFLDRLLQHQLEELKLALAIVKSKHSTTYFLQEPSQSPMIVFGQCVKSAVEILELMRDCLSHSVCVQDAIWIGGASTAIWLAQNFTGMASRDREISLAVLKATQALCQGASTSPNSMPALMSRLLSHSLDRAVSSIPPNEAPQFSMPPPPPPPQANIQQEEAQWGQGLGAWNFGGAETDTTQNLPFLNLGFGHRGFEPTNNGGMLFATNDFDNSSFFPQGDDPIWQALFPASSTPGFRA